MVSSPIGCADFKLSNDPEFVQKLKDIVGLYLDPPEHALVLCWTRRARSRRWIERSRDCRFGRTARTMTHDYKRHGTTTLFAALSTLDGTVIGTCMSGIPTRNGCDFSV